MNWKKSELAIAKRVVVKSAVAADVFQNPLPFYGLTSDFFASESQKEKKKEKRIS